MTFANIRIERRRSSLQLKIFVLIAIVLATIAVLLLMSGILAEEKQFKYLQMEAIRLEQSNAQIAASIENVDTPEGVASIAQREFGLVYPDTVVFKPN